MRNCKAFNNKNRPCQYHIKKGSNDEYCYFHKLHYIHNKKNIIDQLSNGSEIDNQNELNIIEEIKENNINDNIIPDRLIIKQLLFIIFKLI